MFPSDAAWKLLLCRCFSSLFALECTRSCSLAATLNSVFFHRRSPRRAPATCQASHTQVMVQDSPSCRTLIRYLCTFHFSSSSRCSLALTLSLSHAHTQTHPHSTASWGIHGLRLTKTLMCGAVERKQQGRTRCERGGTAEGRGEKLQRGDQQGE